MKFVLILVLITKFGQDAPAATSHEFLTKESCEAAKTAINTAAEKTNIKVEIAVCAAK